MTHRAQSVIYQMIILTHLNNFFSAPITAIAINEKVAVTYK
jgi:hypothetical protein